MPRAVAVAFSHCSDALPDGATSPRWMWSWRIPPLAAT